MKIKSYHDTLFTCNCIKSKNTECAMCKTTSNINDYKFKAELQSNLKYENFKRNREKGILIQNTEEENSKVENEEKHTNKSYIHDTNYHLNINMNMNNQNTTHLKVIAKGVILKNNFKIKLVKEEKELYKNIRSKNIINFNFRKITKLFVWHNTRNKPLKKS